MARNINADEVLNKLPDYLPYKASVKRVLMQASSEDIASGDEAVERCSLSFAFKLMEMEERGKQLMWEHDAKVVLELLSDLKKEIHNKAVHSHNCKIDSYISLKALDGIIQKYINKYTEGKKHEN